MARSGEIGRREWTQEGKEEESGAYEGGICCCCGARSVVRSLSESASWQRERDGERGRERNVGGEQEQLQHLRLRRPRIQLFAVPPLVQKAERMGEGVGLRQLGS